MGVHLFQTIQGFPFSFFRSYFNRTIRTGQIDPYEKKDMKNSQSFKESFHGYTFTSFNYVKKTNTFALFINNAKAIPKRKPNKIFCIC